MHNAVPAKPEPFENFLYSYLGILAETANYIEASAEIEKASGKKITDFAKVWADETLLKSATEKMGAERMARLAILMVRLSTFNLLATLALPVDEKMKAAKELREVVTGLKSMFEETSRAKA